MMTAASLPPARFDPPLRGQKPLCPPRLHPHIKRRRRGDPFPFRDNPKSVARPTQRARRSVAAKIRKRDFAMTGAARLWSCARVTGSAKRRDRPPPVVRSGVNQNAYRLKRRLILGILGYCEHSQRRTQVNAALDRLRHGDRGATAIEYALIAGLVAVVIVATVTAVGIGVNNLFNAVATSF
jgi:pilus assembly protein Flp/PilA